MNRPTLNHVFFSLTMAFLSFGINAQITVDGVRDALYGDPFCLQDTPTLFGNSTVGQLIEANGSELNGAYAIVDGSNLCLMFTGNLESNYNKIEVFLDTRSGGQNQLRGDNPVVDFDGLNRMGFDGIFPGMTFDAGFEADYFITSTCGFTGVGYQLFANMADVLTGGGGAGLFLGGSAVDDNIIINPNGVIVAIDNSNTMGVDDGLVNDPSMVTTGWEICIPLSEIGNPAGPIKVMAFINGAGHDFVSNQGLCAITGAINLGEPRLVDFSSIPGDQFFTIVPPDLTATKTDVELVGNGDGIADQGEIYRYTVTIDNDAMAGDAIMAVFQSALDFNTSLIAGSVTTTQGSVTTGNAGGDASVEVNLGNITPGSIVTITFDALIDIQFPATEISCQGTVSGVNFSDLNTDDPDTGDIGDATITPITAPMVSFTKTDEHIDSNNDGKVNHGEIIRYTLVVSNAPNVGTALDVSVNSGVDPNADLVIGSVTTTQGTVVSGNTGGDTEITVNVGDIGPGSSETIMFDFEVTFGGSGTFIECQATASGANFDDVLSDDPEEPGDMDPTLTPIPTLSQWSILILGLLSIIIGMVRIRETQRSLHLVVQD